MIATLGALPGSFHPRRCLAQHPAPPARRTAPSADDWQDAVDHVSCCSVFALYSAWSNAPP